jgi:hypothetical protein
MSNTEAQMEMPRYTCHKQVWALKIKMIGINEEDGSGLITPEDDRYKAFEVSAEYMEKHKPQYGGYYVVDKYGYKSFELAVVFADGYSRNSGHCMCGTCKQGIVHDSDCAVHNMPAYPNGDCDCAADK